MADNIRYPRVPAGRCCACLPACVLGLVFYPPQYRLYIGAQLLGGGVACVCCGWVCWCADVARGCGLVLGARADIRGGAVVLVCSRCRAVVRGCCVLLCWCAGACLACLGAVPTSAGVLEVCSGVCIACGVCWCGRVLSMGVSVAY